jgi:alkanesulfonate monooxygenase SsuD/methylene tetrahydromethanopterin reductase-like flavin-dependent oxidoreductase (luciferase family)
MRSDPKGDFSLRSTRVTLLHVRIGIGLPATIAGASGGGILDWARRAEEASFSSLGIIDRLIYPNFEPLITLAAVAGATSRIRLVTSILIAPLRSNELILAKEAASLDALSNGRLTLGLGLGSRDDDYELSGLPTNGRGRTLDRQLERMRRVWSDDADWPEARIGPPPYRSAGPELLVAGHVEASLRRVARFGDGWIYGRSSPQEFGELAAAVDAAWAAAGRSGAPRKVSQGYFSLGPNAGATAEAYLLDYYAWLGDVAKYIAADALTDAAAVRAYVDAHADAGCDELILFPCSTDVGEVDRLREVVSDKLA